MQLTFKTIQFFGTKYMKADAQVVFFGTGPVAAKSLELLAQHTNIEAVITKPKPTHHKGSYPVIDIAEKLGLPIYYVENKKAVSELFQTAAFKSNVGILIDFGIIVTQNVIDYFQKGIVNSHFSLLPQWRGADPISFAILSGQKKTGVSLMLIDEGMDTGKLLASRVHHISQDSTTKHLTEELVALSDTLLKEYIPKYLAGDVMPRNQPHPDRATYSRKLTKEDGRIDWNKPAVELERQIRAFMQWPKSYTTLGTIDIIITRSRVYPNQQSVPGTIILEGKKLFVQTQSDWLEILELQPAGKKIMSASSFIAGYGSRLNNNPKP